LQPHPGCGREAKRQGVDCRLALCESNAALGWYAKPAEGLAAAPSESLAPTPDVILDRDTGTSSKDFPMTTIKKHRHTAFLSQQARCCYCELPMWEQSPTELKHLGLPPESLKPLRCTAEHLVARQDGGNNSRQNIAAACHRCNKGRHARKAQLSPDRYRRHVQRRLRQGKWHNSPLVQLAASLNCSR